MHALSDLRTSHLVSPLNINILGIYLQSTARSIMLSQTTESPFLRLNNIHCTYPRFLYPFICRWTLRLFLYLGCCECRQRESALLSSCSLKCPQWPELGKAKAGNSIQISHVGDRYPTTSTIITCCLTGSAMTGIEPKDSNMGCWRLKPVS